MYYVSILNDDLLDSILLIVELKVSIMFLPKLVCVYAQSLGQTTYNNWHENLHKKPFFFVSSNLHKNCCESIIYLKKFSECKTTLNFIKLIFEILFLRNKPFALTGT